MKKLVNYTSILAGILFHTSIFAFDIRISGDQATSGTSAQSDSCSLFGEQIFTGAAGNTEFTHEQSFSGDIGLKLTVQEGHKGWGVFGGVIDFRKCDKITDGTLRKGDEIWVRTRLLIPDNWEWNSGRNKFLRLRTYHYEDGVAKSDGYNDLYINGNNPEAPFNYIYEGEGRWEYFGGLEDNFERNVWKTIELYIKLDNKLISDGGSAAVRLWVDGKLIGETLERRTLNTDDGLVTSLNYFTYYGNETSPKTQSIYADDLFITTEPPLNFDTHGNRYIGMGEPGTRTRTKPKEPTNVSIKWPP
jgi:hypothetical protein